MTRFKQFTEKELNYLRTLLRTTDAALHEPGLSAKLTTELCVELLNRESRPNNHHYNSQVPNPDPLRWYDESPTWRNDD